MKRAVIYTRVSTGKQAESGLSLDDQVAQCGEAIERRGWKIVEHCADQGVSAAKSVRRPALDSALKLLAAGDADVLVVAKQDRLARTIVLLGQIMATAEREGWDLVILDRDVDTSTPAGRLMLHVLGAMAEYESAIIGERAKMTHRQRKARGLRAGQPPILLDDVRLRIASERAEGRTQTAIATDLNDQSVPTARGGRWYASTVRHVCRSVELDNLAA